jgi:trk system potassium uptake protein TrkH
MVGSGAFSLFKTQVGDADDKLMPKFRRIAQWLMICYFFLSMLALIAYMLVGMPFFDAVCWMFATVSTGGFVVHSKWLTDPGCQIVSVVVMFAAATSFNLHFKALRQGSLRVYPEDKEWCWWVMVTLASLFIIWLEGAWFGVRESFNHTIFQVMSLVSSTGYLVPHEWHLGRHLIVTLVILGYIGGCSGSTSSGVKWGRIYMIKELISGAYAGLLAPHLVLKNRPRLQLITLILAYVVLLFFTVFAASFILAMSGIDSSDAFDLSWTSTTNLGAVLGQALMRCTDFQLTVLTAAMLIGRVECVTFFIIFLRRFWVR